MLIEHIFLSSCCHVDLQNIFSVYVSLALIFMHRRKRCFYMRKEEKSLEFSLLAYALELGRDFSTPPANWIDNQQSKLKKRVIEWLDKHVNGFHSPNGARQQKSVDWWFITLNRLIFYMAFVRVTFMTYKTLALDCFSSSVCVSRRKIFLSYYLRVNGNMLEKANNFLDQCVR